MTTAGPILVLGGTSEAWELAETLHAHGRSPVLSFVGGTAGTRVSPVRTRIGSFGGVRGLVSELQRAGYRMLIDATHPFAARMARNAESAARVACIPHLRLVRPMWQPQPGDDWHRATDLAVAAGKLEELGARRALLAIGRNQIATFPNVPGVHFVVRSIEPPQAPPPLADHTVVLGRGPFTLDGEVALLVEQRVDVLVTRNSGGQATSAKLLAARDLGLPVIMIERPNDAPAGQVSTVDQALAWIEQQLTVP